MHDKHEPDPGSLLRSADVMSLLDISRRTLDRWVESGKLPVVRVGGSGQRRYRRRDVEVLLAGRPAA